MNYIHNISVVMKLMTMIMVIHVTKELEALTSFVYVTSWFLQLRHTCSFTAELLGLSSSEYKLQVCKNDEAEFLSSSIFTCHFCFEDETFGKSHVFGFLYLR